MEYGVRILTDLDGIFFDMPLSPLFVSDCITSVIKNICILDGLRCKLTKLVLSDSIEFNSTDNFANRMELNNQDYEKLKEMIARNYYDRSKKPPALLLSGKIAWDLS